jgi:hypothetical protein
MLEMELISGKCNHFSVGVNTKQGFLFYEKSLFIIEVLQLNRIVH